MVQVKKLKDGSRQVILTAQQFDQITKVLTELAAKTKASTILLADISGQLITQRGNTEDINTAILSALAASDFAATSEMAKLVGEDAKFKLDKENFIDSVVWLISNPSTKQLQINTKRMLHVYCETKDYCTWDYFYKGEHRRNGYVKFNAGTFVEYSDITQNIKIIESK